MSSTRNIDIGDKEYANLSIRAWQPNMTAHDDGSEFYQVNDTIYIDVIVDPQDETFERKAYRCITAHNSSANLITDIDNWEELWPNHGETHPTVAISLPSNEDITAFSAPLNVKDGVTLVPGTSRILLTGQTIASENGIWIYSGDGSVLARPHDYLPQSDNYVGEFVVVDSGTFEDQVFFLVDTSNADNNTVEVNVDETIWNNNSGDELVKVSANDNVANFLYESFDVVDAADGSRIDGVNENPIDFATDTDEAALMTDHSGIALATVNDAGGAAVGREVVQAHLLAKTGAADDYETDNAEATPLKARPIKFWMGTQAEKDAIATPDPGTVYFKDNN